MAGEDLTLEKLRAAERLGGVEQEIKLLVELKRVEHQHMTEILSRISRTLYGDGTEGGLVTSVSNHTQTLKVLTGVLWAMATVLISLGLKAVFDKLIMGLG